MSNREWRVIVQNPYRVGDIGTAVGATEEEARNCAISKYGEMGSRTCTPDGVHGPRERNHIYEDDDFDVRPS